MTGNELHYMKLPTAPRGSKKGWQSVSGKVPPVLYENFMALVGTEHKHPTDLVHEAVALLVESRRAA